MRLRKTPEFSNGSPISFSLSAKKKLAILWCFTIIANGGRGCSKPVAIVFLFSLLRWDLVLALAVHKQPQK